MENNYLAWRYYENDPHGFYSLNMNLRCSEQMIYQSLRKYQLDFHLFFCDDINISIIKVEPRRFVGPNSFEYYREWCDDVVVTTKSDEAESAINNVIESGEIVIFQAPFEKLKTYVWYGQTNRMSDIGGHNAIIIGQDTENYYYLDSPPTRNTCYFIPHPVNTAIGLLDKAELLEAFKEKCKIGYIKADERRIKEGVHPIERILQDSIRNYKMGREDEKFIVGRKAYLELIKMLEEKQPSSFTDPFISNCIQARYKRVRFCGIKSGVFIEKDKNESMLNEIIVIWGRLENLVIKYNITHKDNDLKNIIDKLKRLIYLNDEFVDQLGKGIFSD